MHGRDEKFIKVLYGNVMGVGHLGDPAMDERIILKCILNK